MKSKDFEFMEAFFKGLKDKGISVLSTNGFTQNAILRSVRTFYEYNNDKAVSNKIKNLVLDGMFEGKNGGFCLTESAINKFG